MKFIPMLFSTPMVQAILEGRKTMTRRVVKDQTFDFSQLITGLTLDGKLDKVWIMDEPDRPGIIRSIKCPYGQAGKGDVLWVRESFQVASKNPFIYKADNWVGDMGWKPSIYMPKTACRIFLQVKSVRVERLQDISEEDANVEGAEHYIERNYPRLIIDKYPTAKEDFCKLWQTINGPESWDGNPWVWVVEFEKCDKPENFL